MDKLERRSFTVGELRVDDDSPKISGYAAVFEELSVPLWGFREKIQRGAFRDSIKVDDVRALWNHDPNFVLGRNLNRTLELEEDERGLKVTIIPPDTQWARDAVESIRRGDVDQMSFGFTVPEGGDAWDHSDKTNPIRTLRKVHLFDVSPVTYPAYPQTSVSVRTALSAVGIDDEQLAQLIIRAQRGDELASSDRDQIHALAQRIDDLVSDPGEDSGIDERRRQVRKLILETYEEEK